MCQYNVITSSFISHDEKIIAYREWCPAGMEISGTMITLHGIGACLEIMDNLGWYFSSHKHMRIICMELRGFGRWNGTKKWGYHDPEDVLNDLKILLQSTAVDFSRPVFLLGMSFGCMLLGDFIMRCRIRFDGVIMTSPFFPDDRMRWALPLVWMPKKILPGLKIGMKRFRTTNNAAYALFRKNLNLFARHCSVEVLYESVRYAGRITEQLFKKALGVPLLICYGDRDFLVTTRHIREVFEKIQTPEKILKIYPDSHHMLVNDLYRARIFEDIWKFIEVCNGNPSFEIPSVKQILPLIRI